ncbi:MAG: RNA methyltransferase [Victivallaceae bacterium]|nr:RNA methyltransferase [Victivallaceae bacterium]
MERDAALTRREESLLRALCTRGGRRRSGCCRCEGVRSVRELIANAPCLVEFLLVTERGLSALGATGDIMPRIVSEKEFSEYSETVNHQGVLAVARTPEETVEPEGEFILALDGVGDPGNFGTMARTFRAVGGRSLWYTAGSIDPWGDKAVRSGLGSQFALKLRKFPDLPSLVSAAAKSGYPKCFVTDPHSGEVCFECDDLFDHSVIVIGGEANGVSCFPDGTRHVTIPMPGDYESLNAAQAATVVLMEKVRRMYNKGKSK